MSSTHTPVNVFWFRRDLRLHDNAGLSHALNSGRPVLPVFIFDRDILGMLEDEDDRRVEFIHAALLDMQEALAGIGSTLDVRYGRPLDVFRDLLQAYSVEGVFTNHDYEPYARRRDGEVARLLESAGASLHTFKDQVLFEKDEVLKDDGGPYTVFTPYSRKWQKVLSEKGIPQFASEKSLENIYRQPALPIPSLGSMGFRPAGLSFPSKTVRDELFARYGDDRNFPSLPATSRLGVHLRFGTISIRRLARKASSLSPVFLNELVWRDFYHMILWHFPQVGEGKAFKPAYDLIKWRNNEEEFDAWCRGMTGYPIVDAGMRELSATGFMHNRVRMITASFLSKHLLVDWRWGEAWFARKLLDFDLAANNGGWQWAAGSGCDAAPYFRIFNPRLQTEKFDRKLEYIRHWVPEFGQPGYPPPIVQHELARKRCLEVYGAALKP
jgi:deoxyribodipyrimidine photo-lyase